MRKIVSLVLNGVMHDSRVKKTAKTLSRFGDVTVVGFRLKHADAAMLDLGDFTVDRECVYLRPDGGWRKRLMQVFVTLRFALSVLRKYGRADVIVCNDLETLPIGVAVKVFRNRGVKLIYDSHEYQTETIGQGPVRKRFTRMLERWGLGWCDATIVVSPSIAREYVRLYNIRPPAVVMNCPPFSTVERTGRLRRALGIPGDTLLFLYQGGLSPGRGVEDAVEIFRHLDGDERVAVFMGYGPLDGWLRDVAAACPAIKVLAAVPPEEILEYSADADFGMCLTENACLNNYYCLPNKLFEYLMARVPVVVSDLYELKRLVNAHGLGVVVGAPGVGGIEKAIEECRTLDRHRLLVNIDIVRKQWCWEAQELVWAQVMDDVLVNAQDDA